MQAMYDTEGTVGEGAFGVVLKAAVKMSAPTADDSGDGEASAPAAAAATATATSGGSAGDTQSQTPRQFVAIKKMLNHREGQGIPQDAYREIKVRTRSAWGCTVKPTPCSQADRIVPT